MFTSYISLGSNIGNREKHIITAMRHLKTRVEIEKTSGLYETEPYGYKDQNEFINCVAKIRTDMTPPVLLDRLLRIEAEMGRVRKFKWGPRVIDLDILLYEDFISNSESLTIPHKDMQNRIFILKPLIEIEPELIHPVLKKSVSQLYEKLLNESKEAFKCVNYKNEVLLSAVPAEVKPGRF